MPIRPETKELVDYLNSLLALDRPLITALINFRYQANEKIALHSTVQCYKVNNINLVGILGILNGFFGVFDDGPKANWGAICANIEPNGEIISFSLLENK